MEPSESQHINKHIDELVKQTKCTVRLKTILKRKDLISDEEVENLVCRNEFQKLYYVSSKIVQSLEYIMCYLLAQKCNCLHYT